MPLTKPPHGTPCNSCGLCCMVELCPLAMRVFGRDGAMCPALEQDGDRRLCGLVRNPGTYAPDRTQVYGVAKMRNSAMLLIGLDTLCDAIAPWEKPNLSYQAEMRASHVDDHAVDEAMLCWGVSR